MSDQTPATANIASSSDEDEISLLDLAIALGEEKKVIATITASITFVAIVVSLLLTPVYTAKTVILPPQQQQSNAATALASLGAVAGLAAGAAGIKSPDEMYIAFLQSEGLQNALIEKLALRERYRAKSLLDARQGLKSAVKISSDKKAGLITIEADDTNPEFAATLANAHVKELKVLMGRLAVTEAQQRRVFFEQQLAKSQEDLAKAEAQFRNAKAQSGMQIATILAETGVRATAELYAQIASREVQLQAMGKFATSQNPEMQRIAGELSALRTQLAKMERGGGVAENASPVQQSAVKFYREIKALEATLAIMTGQYEVARVDEAKEGPLIQQVDLATAPERRSRPKRTLIVAISLVIGLFLGVLYSFTIRYIRKINQDPLSESKLQQLYKAWKFS